MNGISPSLKELVAVQIFAKVAQKHYRIRSLCDALAKESIEYKIKQSKTVLKTQSANYIRMIVSHMTTDLQEPDSIIIEQYQKGEAMYLIAKGEV